MSYIKLLPSDNVTVSAACFLLIFIYAFGHNRANLDIVNTVLHDKGKDVIKLFCQYIVNTVLHDKGTDVIKLF